MGSHRNDIWLAESEADDMRTRLKEIGYPGREIEAADELGLHRLLEKHFEYQRHQQEQEDRDDDD